MLFNLKHQQLNTRDIKLQLKNVNNCQPPKVEQLQKCLGEYYLMVMQLQRNNYVFDPALLFSAILTERKAFVPGIGSQILEEVEKALRLRLSTTATAERIIDETLVAVAAIIPGSIYMETPVKKLVSYLLGQLLNDENNDGYLIGSEAAIFQTLPGTPKYIPQYSHP